MTEPEQPTMTVAVTYTFVVEVSPVVALDGDGTGRPPKRIDRWGEDVMQGVTDAVETYVNDNKSALWEPTEIEVLEHPGWTIPTTATTTSA